jgi:hypothetical protein
METGISAQIVKLRSLSRQQLLDLWQELYGRAAPPGIRRELMVPFLAYRIQEKAYGGLKRRTCADLRRIAGGLDEFTVPSELRIQSKIKSGTKILRNWRGDTHEVLVTDSGYEYRAASFRSLSQIARRITGTRWSGPAFFGLRNGAPSGSGSND